MSQRCSVRDLMTVSKREITPQGYLVAPTVLGRCGIQPYSRAELGLDGDPNEIINLMRLPEEVFRPETIASFENVPITDEHPPAGVDAANWKAVSRGHVRDIHRGEGDLLSGTTWVMDGEEVQRIASGKKFTSCGYSFDLDLTPGVDSAGKPFHGYQRKILGDHLSIVDAPRGGPICAVGDQQNKEKIMAMRKLAVDGLPRFEVDELAAEAIETHVRNVTKDRDTVVTDFAAHKEKAKKALDAKDVVIGEKDTAIKAKDTEIADLKAKLAKAQAIDVDALVAERSAVIADAKKLAPELEPKGSSHEIRKLAIAEAIKTSDAMQAVAEGFFGEDGIEKASESQVKAAMKMMLRLGHDAIRTAQDRAVAGALAGGSGNSTSTTDGKVEVVDIGAREDVFLGDQGTAS
jgi:hypothetical protein